MFDLRLGYKVTLSISHYVNFKLISKIIIWFIHKLHNESVPVCHKIGNNKSISKDYFVNNQIRLCARQRDAYFISLFIYFIQVQKQLQRRFILTGLCIISFQGETR